MNKEKLKRLNYIEDSINKLNSILNALNYSKTIAHIICKGKDISSSSIPFDKNYDLMWIKTLNEDDWKTIEILTKGYVSSLKEIIKERIEAYEEEFNAG